MHAIITAHSALAQTYGSAEIIQTSRSKSKPVWCECVYHPVQGSEVEKSRDGSFPVFAEDVCAQSTQVDPCDETAAIKEVLEEKEHFVERNIRGFQHVPKHLRRR
ncbi:hypothetical protein CDAR_29841 [Caerostris darwini]|uniref:Uncharacterized protein n=1 Tax=Caerostris darwini TaxID=1538125 RepID=A0AAV4QQC1_9ARAC|nr:hypothetical protein CDAR_29841 [Caerostris darwini]